MFTVQSRWKTDSHGILAHDAPSTGTTRTFVGADSAISVTRRTDGPRRHRDTDLATTPCLLQSDRNFNREVLNLPAFRWPDIVESAPQPVIDNIEAGRYRFKGTNQRNIV
jgi:hypothetical protein